MKKLIKGLTSTPVFLFVAGMLIGIMGYFINYNDATGNIMTATFRGFILVAILGLILCAGSKSFGARGLKIVWDEYLYFLLGGGLSLIFQLIMDFIH
jgi:drug/metabolite transporter (DMT)-like permease